MAIMMTMMTTTTTTEDAIIYQSLAMSKLHSNSRWVLPSSSTKRETAL